LKHRLEILGVEVDDDKLNKIYENFLSLADSKKEVTDDDVLVLAGQERNRLQAIKLDYLQVTSGQGVRPVAAVTIDIAGEKFSSASDGNGPVDAAINAIRNIIRRQVIVKEFTIQANSRGSNDIGKVHMQVEYNGHIYYGFGANTDIIVASAEAYVDCINKFKK
jgi:2-isopropylmalate synthase